MTCTAVLFQMGKAYFKGKLDSGRSSCTITSHFGPMFYHFITAKFWLRCLLIVEPCRCAMRSTFNILKSQSFAEERKRTHTPQIGFLLKPQQSYIYIYINIYGTSLCGGKCKKKKKQCLFGSYAMIIKGAIKGLASNMEGNILEIKKNKINKNHFFFPCKLLSVFFQLPTSMKHLNTVIKIVIF